MWTINFFSFFSSVRCVFDCQKKICALFFLLSSRTLRVENRSRKRSIVEVMISSESERWNVLRALRGSHRLKLTRKRNRKFAALHVWHRCIAMLSFALNIWLKCQTWNSSAAKQWCREGLGSLTGKQIPSWIKFLAEVKRNPWNASSLPPYLPTQTEMKNTPTNILLTAAHKIWKAPEAMCIFYSSPHHNTTWGRTHKK